MNIGQRCGLTPTEDIKMIDVKLRNVKGEDAIRHFVDK